MSVAHVSIADPAVLVAISAAFAAISGVPALFISRRPAVGQFAATIAIIFAALLGLSGVTAFFFREVLQH